MNKRNFLLAGIAILLFVTACKKDDDPNPNDPNAVPYSTNTTEENKANLESSGEELLTYMEDMQDLTGIEVLMNLASLASGDDVVQKAMKEPMELLSAVKSKNPSNMFDVISVVEADPFEDGLPTLAEIMDEYGGTWDYDDELDDVVQSATSTTEIILNFPGDANDLTTNNATITINNMSTVSVTNELLAEGAIEMPTSAHMDLKYNNVELMTWDFSASYTSEGYPTAINSELTIDEYSFSIAFAHTPFSSVSNTLSLKYNDEILIETYQQVGGNWSQENIEAQLNSEDEDFMPQNIIMNGNAYIQILDLKAMGLVNFKAIGDKMMELEELEESESITEEEFYTQLAATVNANASLGLTYVDPVSKICDVKFKAKEYEGEEYNWYTQDYETYTYWDMGADLHFADGSVVDAETYFKDGFQELIDDYIDFGESLE